MSMSVAEYSEIPFPETTNVFPAVFKTFPPVATTLKSPAVVDNSAALAAVRESDVPADAVRSAEDDTNKEPLAELIIMFPLRSDMLAGDLTRKSVVVVEISTPCPAAVPVLRNMLD
jgi:hypothetical protein